MKKSTLIAFLLGLGGLSSAQVFYVTDSGPDRVWAFDANTGALVNNNVVTFAGRTTIQQSVLLDNGNWLVSDQGGPSGSTRIGDGLFEYSPSGSLVRTFLSGASGHENLRGFAVRNGEIYVAVAGGANANTIQKVNYATGAVSLFSNSPTLTEPWAVDFIGNELVVTTHGSHDVERFDLSGNNLGKFIDSAGGVNDLNRPYQYTVAADGTTYVCGFSRSSSSANPGWGMYRYNSAGVRTGYYNVVSPRGVAILGNGDLLYASGVNVNTLTITGSSTFTTANVATASGASFRFITSGTPVSTVPEPATMAALGLGAAALLRRRRHR